MRRKLGIQRKPQIAHVPSFAEEHHSDLDVAPDLVDAPARDGSDIWFSYLLNFGTVNDILASLSGSKGGVVIPPVAVKQEPCSTPEQSSQTQEEQPDKSIVASPYVFITQWLCIDISSVIRAPKRRRFKPLHPRPSESWNNLQSTQLLCELSEWLCTQHPTW